MTGDDWRRELRAVLGPGRAALAESIEGAIVGAWTPDGRRRLGWWRHEAEAARQQPAAIESLMMRKRDLLRTLRAAERVARRVSLGRVALDGGALAPVLPTIRMWRAVLERDLIRLGACRVGHRPPARGRAIARELAALFTVHGVRWTRSRDGLLARTLRVVLRAVGEPEPQDVYRYLPGKPAN